MSTLGLRVIQLRKIFNISQRELAERVGITEATLSRYENDLREPKAEVICRLAKELNTSTDYLLCNTDNPSIPALQSNYSSHFDINNLPDEAVNEIKNYIDYIKHKFTC